MSPHDTPHFSMVRSVISDDDIFSQLVSLLVLFMLLTLLMLLMLFSITKLLPHLAAFLLQQGLQQPDCSSARQVLQQQARARKKHSFLHIL
jgi:hypothetical protein